MLGKAESVAVQVVDLVRQLPWVVPVAVVSIYIFSFAVYQRWFSPLAKVNGPFWASLSPFWKLLSFNNGNFHETILALHERYGPIVRIAPNEVIISDKSAIREIYNTVQGRDFLKVSAKLNARRFISNRCRQLTMSEFFESQCDAKLRMSEVLLPPSARPYLASETHTCMLSGSG
jgi:hypothetical protein